MSKVIEDMNQFQESQNMMRLADAHADFLRRYSEMIPDDRRRDDFQRELMYQIHLTYREAQTPLTNQLTEFILSQSSPFVVGKL